MRITGSAVSEYTVYYSLKFWNLQYVLIHDWLPIWQECDNLNSRGTVKQCTCQCTFVLVIITGYMFFHLSSLFVKYHILIDLTIPVLFYSRFDSDFRWINLSDLMLQCYDYDQNSTAKGKKCSIAGYVKHLPCTQGLRSHGPVVGKWATLESSDWKYDHIGLEVQLEVQNTHKKRLGGLKTRRHLLLGD